MNKNVLALFGITLLTQIVLGIVIILRTIWIGFSTYGLKVFLTNAFLFWIFITLGSIIKEDKKEEVNKSKSTFRERLDEAMKKSQEQNGST